jgi:hypothetical protein
VATVQVDIQTVKAGRIYKWTRGAHFKVDAQTAGERIEKIRQSNGGVVKPDDVVEDAKSPTSPLHEEFIWDVDEAAKRHWRSTARNLMNHIVVVQVETQSSDEGVHAFHSVRVTTTKRGYISIDEVVTSDDYRQQAIKNALKLLQGLQRRFAYLNELDGVWKAIDQAEADRAASESEEGSE